MRISNLCVCVSTSVCAYTKMCVRNQHLCLCVFTSVCVKRKNGKCLSSLTTYGGSSRFAVITHVIFINLFILRKNNRDPRSDVWNEESSVTSSALSAASLARRCHAAAEIHSLAGQKRTENTKSLANSGNKAEVHPNGSTPGIGQLCGIGSLFKLREWCIGLCSFW